MIHGVSHHSSGVTAADAKLARDAGAKIIRFPFEQDTFSESSYDESVGNAREVGLQVLPVCLSHKAPETLGERQDFAQFCVYVANRFNLNTVEVWNEPNHPGWSVGTPRDYRAILVEATNALHRDGHRSISAGMTSRNYAEFLKVLQVGDADIFAVHPYAASANELLTDVLPKMVAACPKRGPIWITEYGWATGGPQSARIRASEVRQRSHVRDTMRGLNPKRRVKVALYYSLRDAGGEATPANWCGLARPDGAHKPAFDAYRTA